MKLCRIFFVGLIGFGFLYGCAAVKPQTVTFCENRQCNTIKESDSKQELLGKVTKLIKKNLNKDITLYETPPGKIVGGLETASYFEKGFSFYVQGGPMPGVATVKTIKITDIVYIDRENLEIKLRVLPKGTWNVTPLLFAEADAVISIRSATEIRYESFYLLTWMIVGTSVWSHEWLIDYIDVDKGIFGGYYAVKGGGPLTLGGGKGYVQLSFGHAAPEKPSGEIVAVTPPLKTETNEPVKELPPELIFKVAMKDSSGDNIFKGGEEVSLKVEIENKGKGEAKSVQVILSGHDDIIRYMGDTRTLGNVKPGEKKTAEFKAVLPLQIAEEAGELKVRVREDRGYSPAEMKVLKVALKPGVVTEKVEVISAVPKLTYAVHLRDQNHDRVLNGGEEISLQVEVENNGEATAEGVQVLLSGHPVLIKAFGTSMNLGPLKVGEKKLARFKAVLPSSIPSEQANLRITVSESRGYSPSERRILQVAMRALEEKEVVEVLSEVDVDDIPPRVKDYVNNENYALVIGIGNYREKVIPEIKFATRDAEVTAKYFEHLSGIPKSNIKVLTDDKATKSDLEAYLEDWLQKRVTKDSKVFIYYAGHGAPDPMGKDAYIVPYEGHPDFPSKLYPLSKMYDALNRLPAKEVVVMLDSCFSGAKGRSVTSEGARPLFISLGTPVLARGKLSVIAGSTGSQISSDYLRTRHGLFTYFLLRGMRGEADKEKKGLVDLGSLFSYVKRNVSEKALLEFNREQTPVFLPLEASDSKFKIPVSKTH
jgi:hypothetical protein